MKSFMPVKTKDHLEKYENYAKLHKIEKCTEGMSPADVDHSFLTYKKELLSYGYKVEKISMKEHTVTFEKIME